VNISFATTSSVRLLSDRHRTEWNWVEYRLALKNVSNTPLANPTIRYFAENPRIQYCKAHPNEASCAGMQFNSFEVDTTLRTVIDDFTIVDSVKPQFYYNSKYTVISLKFFGTMEATRMQQIHKHQKFLIWVISSNTMSHLDLKRPLALETIYIFMTDGTV